VLKLKMLVPTLAVPLSIGLAAPAVLGATGHGAATSSSSTTTTTKKTTATTSKPTTPTTSKPTTPTTSKPTTHHTTDYEAVAGVFKTRATATKTVDALAAKGLKDFKVESDGKRRFEVEHPFTTLAEAKTQQAALVTDGYKAASAERS
jgi:hypothetical protein